MIRRTFALLGILILASLATGQGPFDPNEGLRITRDSSTGVSTLSWWGSYGRNYFIQESDDLIHWNYLPMMDSGAYYFGPLQWSLSSSANAGYFRLRFDNDLDGLPDDWELHYYNRLGVGADTPAARGDGLTNLQVLLQGLDPLSIYNTTEPGPGQNIPVISLISSASGILTAGDTVTLTATASEVNGVIARVDFYQDGSYLGSAWSDPYTWQQLDLVPGNYQFSAVAVDALGFSTPSNSTTVAVVAPVTQPTSTRYSRGNGIDPTYLSYVVAVDFEKGILLNPMGTAQFSSSNAIVPWFMRIQKSTAYQVNYTPPPPNPPPGTYGTISYPSSLAFENPLVAFGAEGGGSPLYTGQSYTFGVGSGGEYAPVGGDFLLEVYAKSTLAGGQTGVAPVNSASSAMITLPKPGTAAWEAFALNGYVMESTVNDNSNNALFKVAVQYAAGGTVRQDGTILWSGANGSDQWGQYLPAPLLVRVTSYTTAYYLQLGYRGITLNRSLTSSPPYWMAITDQTNPSGSGTYSISFTMDFQTRPPWRSVYIDQPHFQGIPLPSAYQGKTLAELSHSAQPVSDTLAAPAAGTLLDLDSSPELRQHPILDKFVSDMGSDPLALANYVLNEIELTDAISYSDSGATSDQSINLGGVNRGALATFLEGQGSPTEQCALLVYLLRKANVQCGYVFLQPAQHNRLLMLDEQLSKLLRMQLKGAKDPLGTPNVLQLIPTNYPWVAAYIGGKWVHIFPWLKDTAIEEGQDLYQFLPKGLPNGYPTGGYQTGRQWLNQYLLDDPAIRSLSTEYDNPGVLFPLFVKNSLQTNFPGVSIDQLGVNIYNRKNYFTSWGDLPRPWQTPQVGGSNLSDNLTAIANIFDTISVQVYKGNTATGPPIIQTAPIRTVDLHNRRFLLYSLQNGATNTHTLKLSLEAFRPSTQGNPSGSFSTSDDLLNSQLATAALTSGDDALVFHIDYKRHQSLGATFQTPDHWAPFLGLSDALEVTDSRPLRKGDMAAFVLNYGRVTSAMLNVHAQQYQLSQQQIINNPNLSVDPEIAQGLPAFMMGMSYYYNVSQTTQQLLNLTKTNIVSFFGHGFAKLSPKRDSLGNISNNGQLGQISLIYPKVDMAFQRMAWANNGTLHPDSGQEQNPPITDWGPILIGEISAQEHRTLNKFFQQSAAISTVKLLDKALGASLGVVRIDASNYDRSQPSSPWNTQYPANGKTLAQWAGYDPANPNAPSLYKSIVDGFSSTNWDANYQQVLITPGPMTVVGANNQIFYQGIGAFVTGIGISAAYITDNMNVLNGGWADQILAIDTTALSLAGWSMQLIGGSYSLIDASNQPSGSPPTLLFQPYSVSFQDPSAGLQQLAGGTLIISDQVSVNSFNSSLASLYPSGNAPSLTNDPAGVARAVYNFGGVTQTSNYGSIVGILMQGIADPVNSVTGEFYVNALDVRLNGPMPLDIRRNYGSQNLADGSFGYGWKMAYVPYLVVSQDSNNGVIINSLIYATEMDGSVIAYRRQTSPNTRWVPTAADNPQLTNVAGDSAGSLTNVFNNHIDQTVNGTVTFYTLYGVDGSIRKFRVRSFTTPATPNHNDGLTRTRPYLATWQDNRGNFYAFYYYGDGAGEDYTTPGFGNVKRIVSSNGSFVAFNYDVYGHIIEAFTGDGRRLQYKYNDYGDLVQVTLPDASTIGYQYSHQQNTTTGATGVYSEHLLVEEDKPQGRVLVNTYDNATSRRVTQQQATVGTNFALVTNAKFGYFNADNSVRGAAALNTAISGYTVITDVNQHTTKYEYTNSLITKVTDPLNQTVTQIWFQPGDTSTGAYPRSLKSRTDKRKLLTEYQYDSKGNLTQKNVTGDLTGNGTTGGDVAKTSSIYNALNMVTQTTDPVGNIVKYTYGDTVHPYLPTLIEKDTPSGAISTTQLLYEDVKAGGAGGYGLLHQETKAAGQSDQAVTTYTNNSHGFVTQSSRPTGTSDPTVVVNYTYNMRGELTSETDDPFVNRTTNYAYDGRGNRVWMERHEAGGALVSWQYDYYNQNGEIEWSDGPRYNPEDYVLRQYDGAGRLSQEIKWRSQASSDGSSVQAVQGLDDAYATTFYDHDSFGNLAEVRDPRHNSTTMTYDWIGQMLGRKVYNGAANSTVLSSESFAYEPGGQVSQYTNPLNGVTTKSYTSTGQLKQQTDAVTSAVLQWRYDLLGRVTTEILSNGNYWATTYDDYNRTVTRRFTTTGPAPPAPTSTVTPTPPPAGGTGTSALLLPSANSPNTTVLATETTAFDRRGNIVSKRDTEKNLFTTTYDLLDRIKSTTGPAASGSTAQETTSRIYGAGEKVRIVTDALGQKTQTTSDALGRPNLVQVEDKNNTVIRQTSYVYSPDHNSVTVTEGTGSTAVPAVTTTTFTDTFGHPVLLKHGDGSYRVTQYDANGNKTSLTDERGAVTSYTYDALNHLQSETLPASTPQNGAVINYDRDAAGNLQSRRMPEGLTSGAVYDGAGRKRSEELDDRRATHVTRNYTYAYYTAGPDIGLLQSVTDPRGFSTTITYDDYLRPSKLISSGSTTPERNQQTIYTYDTLSRLKSVAQSYLTSSTGASTLVQRNYDGYGHINQETVSVGGTTVSQWNQSWDGAGCRSALNWQLAAQGSGAGSQYAYQHNAAGLLTKIISGGVAQYTYTYGNNALLTQRTTPLLTENITQRDKLGRILTDNVAGNGTTLLSETMTWRADSRLKSYSATGQITSAETRTYGYDTRGRLTNEPYVLPQGGQLTGQQAATYSFDQSQLNTTSPSSEGGLGVRTLQFVNATTGNEVTAQNSFFQVTQDYALSSNNTYTLGYDAAGEVTRRAPSQSGGQTQTLTWDAWGRLVKVQARDSFQTGSDFTILYDGLGRRVQSTSQNVQSGTPSGNAGTLTYYYDPQVEFLELGINNNGTRTWKVYGPDVSGVYGGAQGTGGLDALVDETSGFTKGSINNFFGDSVGSNQSGNSTSYYTSYGSVLGGYGAMPGSTLSTPPLTQQWRGHYIDATGFYYMGARYYEPASGRFLSADPLGHAASMSLYDYAHGDPVNGLDPDGRFGKNAKNAIEAGLQYGQQGLNLVEANVDTPLLIIDSMGQGLLGIESNRLGLKSLGTYFQNNSGSALMSMANAWTQANQGPMGPVMDNEINAGVQWLPIGSNNQQFLAGYLTGTLPQTIIYPPDSRQTQDMRLSLGVEANIYAFYLKGGKNQEALSYGSEQAYYDTIFNRTTRDLSSTAMQVAGYTGGTAVNNGDGTVTFTIPNVAGTNSLFYHLTPNMPSGYSGPMHSVTQIFSWTQPIDSSKVNGN